MAAVASEKLLGWSLELGQISYERVLGWQHGLVKMREHGLARDTILTVEHHPVVTVGKDGHRENFDGLDEEPYFVERGGDVTYHGPGQLVAYFIFNLTRRGRDIHLFMDGIQDGIIKALKEIGITATRGDEHTGVWVKDKKIASIGVAVKRWITFHGAAINLNTKLSDFKKINPCGLDAAVMTSAQKILGKKVNLKTFSHVLIEKYAQVFDTDFTPVSLEALAETLESQAGGYEI
ncbi:MAG: lipoyl(octanoyl) transferase LipB [Candidatus Zixiibacteriota bacterium]